MSSPNSPTGSLSDPEKREPPKPWQKTVLETPETNTSRQEETLGDVEKGTTIIESGLNTPSATHADEQLSVVSTEDPDVPPDGGWGAWSMCIATHIVLANTWGFVNAFGIFQAYYTDFLSLPPSQISWIGSVQVFLAFFLSTLSGRVSDAGYFRAVFLTGTAFQVAAVLASSFCTRYWQLMLSQGVGVGIASGLLCCPTMSVAGTYFRRRRSLAFGIMTCGNVTGGLVFPAMARQLLPTVGFAWAMRAIGFIQAAMLLGCSVVVKTRVRPDPSGPLVDLKAFRELEYTFYGAGMFFNLSGTFIAWYYTAAYGRTGISPALSYPDSLNLMLVMNGIGAAGRLGAAALADRVGPLNVLLPCALASSLCCFAWTAVRTPAAVYAWAAVLGVVSGGLQALFPAGLTSLTTDVRAAGLRMGMIFTLVSLCVLAGPPAAGAAIERARGSYVGAQALAGTHLLVGAGFIAASRRVKTGGRWRARL